jgi:flagellar basal-body rod protein FlgF
MHGIPVAKEPRMIQGIYQGAASMSALEKWQAAISANLAAGSATGYKKQDTTFSSIAAGSKTASTDAFDPTVGLTMPQSQSKLNMSQGPLLQTGKDMDLAVQGPGLFQVKTTSGVSAFTRDGEFHIDATGKLVTNQGNTVLGASGPIVTDPNLGAVTVNQTGEVSQNGVTIGKIPLYDVGASGGWQQMGSGMFVPKDGSQTSVVANPDMLQGYVEQSNVTPLQEMVSLISVSRAYEISQKLVTTLDQSTHSAIEVLGTP